LRPYARVFIEVGEPLCNGAQPDEDRTCYLHL
jgi:hypothetical protein